MKTFKDIINECLESVEEIFPWDLAEIFEQGQQPMILDVREPYEFDIARIKDSLNVPRGILETACEYDYEETVPELVTAHERDIIVVCRSGNRSVLAADTMQQMGYQSVKSLKTGLKGWNEYEQVMVDANGNEVDIDEIEQYFTPNLSPEQLAPK